MGFQISQCKRDTCHKMGLPLRNPSITICPKSLQDSEQHKIRQHATECGFIKCRIYESGTFHIAVNHSIPDHFRYPSLCLPKKRCHIIFNRATSATLEINQIRHRAISQHDIPALEIPDHERCGSFRVLKQQVVQIIKFLLEPGFRKIEPCLFQKTVFEIIQIPTDHMAVHSLLGTNPPIQTLSPEILHFGQPFRRTLKKMYGFLIKSPCYRCIPDNRKQGYIAQILLKVTQIIG